MSSSPQSNQDTEVSRLRYKGNDVPMWLIAIWMALGIFCIVYLAAYMAPDLQIWWGKWLSEK